MADYYCDHSAYASVLGTTPTWGVPQEGDGSSKDPSTASATAALTFSVNATTSPVSSVTLCGVTFNCIATAPAANSANFQVGADLSSTLTNLVNAINTCSTSVAAVVAVGTPQIRNLVFARVTGGNTLEVMMRVGSASLNGASNTNCRITTANWTTVTAVPVNFAGGTGGCWGMLFNESAVGAGGSYAIGTYGLFSLARPLVWVTQPTVDDPIWIRSRSGFTLSFTSAAPNFGTQTYSHQWIIDTNTQWTGDAGGQITISCATSSIDWNFRLVADNMDRRVRCVNPGGLRMLWRSVNGAGHFLLLPNGVVGNRGRATWDGVVFEESNTSNTTVSGPRFFGSSIFCAVRMKNCSFIYGAPRTTWIGLIQASGLEGHLIFEGCRVITNHTGANDPGPLIQSVGFNNAGIGALQFTGCSIEGWPFGKYRIIGVYSGGNGAPVVFEGCTGLVLSSAYLGLIAHDVNGPYTQTFTYTSADPGQAFRFEYRAGAVDWNPDATPPYPTRSALLMDGTPWSIKMDWLNGVINGINAFVSPRLSVINRLANGPRTVSVDFLSPVSLTSRDVVMRVHYVSTDGKVYTETTFAKSTAMTSPVSTWNGTGSYPNHSARRLSLTTARAIKQGTEVAAYIEMTNNPPGGVGIQIYVDPEPALS